MGNVILQMLITTLAIKLENVETKSPTLKKIQSTQVSRPVAMLVMLVLLSGFIAYLTYVA